MRTLLSLFVITLFAFGTRAARAQVAQVAPVDQWTTGGQVRWVGGVWAGALEIFDGTTVSGWIETPVTGPGTFRIKLQASDDPYLSAALSVDGVGLTSVSLGKPFGTEGPPAPQMLSCVIPPGPHTLRLTACIGCDGFGGQEIEDPVIFAGLASLTPPDAVISQAMDEPAERLWYHAGDPAAAIVNDDTHDGVDALFLAPQTGPAWIETQVAGPATLIWWRKGTGRVTMDRVPVITADHVVWKRESVFVPPGTHAVRWEPNKSGALWLDAFSMLAAPPVSLEEALDAPGQTFTSSAGWSGSFTTAASQGSDLAWARVTNTTCWLETIVTGPALVESAWRIRGTGPQFNILMDGRFAGYGHGLNAGENTGKVQIVVPPGGHTLRWEQPAYDTPVNMLVMLDAVSVVPSSAAADQFNTALDGEGFAWSTGGDALWQGAPGAFSRDGSDMAFSPWLAEGQTSWLQTTVTGPGSFSVWLRSLFGNTPNGGALFVDDRLLHRYTFTDQVTWRREVVEVPAGNHTIRFQIHGISSGGTMSLDEATWIPPAAAAPAISAALDFTPALLHSAGAVVAVDNIIHSDGVDSLRIETEPEDYRGNPTKPVTLWVDGPGLLSCKARCQEGALILTTDQGSASTVSTDWITLTVPVLPGRRPVEFVSTQTTPWWSFTGPRLVWVDAVTLTPNAVPLSEALGNAGLLWTTSPANPWSGMAAGAGQPLRAGSGPNDTGGPSWLETTVTGPAVAAFDALGAISLQLDGIPNTANANGGASGWTRRAVWVPAGRHTLRWIASNGALAAVSVSRLTGNPSLTLSGGSPVFSVPLPSPATNILTLVETAPSPEGPWTLLTLNQQNTVRYTAEVELVVRLPMPPGGTRLFARGRYQFQ